MMSLAARRAARACPRRPLATKVPKIDELLLFPNESEGNTYSVNWSLSFDGVTNQGAAYLNARLPLLNMRLPSKMENGVATCPSPSPGSSLTPPVEAGDGVSFDDFEEALQDVQWYLSSGLDLLVEDASAGTHADARVGVRVVTDSAAVALAARALLVPAPLRKPMPKARFDGWNVEYNMKLKPTWNGTAYDLPDPSAPLPGERPVLVLAPTGGPYAAMTEPLAAASFMQREDRIVGATVILAGPFTQCDLAAAVGHAASVMLNERDGVVCAPSAALVGPTGATGLVVGAGDAFAAEAARAGALYGAYYNAVTPGGVAALFGGAVGVPPSGAATPALSVGGVVTAPLHPVNLVGGVSHLMFFEPGSGPSSLDKETAAARLAEASDESRAELCSAVASGAVSCSTVGSATTALELMARG